ncbi:MAG: hydroxyethylthiazole kinase, partial [Clostridiales bacterium]|nr:hydroxyethylthiazole kinase [Clostridiales bacterium]
MMIAGMRAKELGHTILLDPVGAGASFLRTKTAQSIVEEVKPDIIRGNISEIKTLAKGSGTTKGVDADAADTVTEENLDEMVAFVKAFAEKTDAVIAITGAIDLVADAEVCYVIRNGRKEMSRITGTGCQLSGMATAYAVANPDNKVDAVAAAVCLMGLAGEIGWSRMQEGDGNSTYRNRIIDAIFNIDAKTLEEGAKYEIR